MRDKSNTDFWNDAAVEVLRNLWKVEGQSASFCARKMHTTRSAILGKVFRLGWKRGDSRTTNRLATTLRMKPHRRENRAPQVKAHPWQPSGQQSVKRIRSLGIDASFVGKPIATLPGSRPRTLVDLPNHGVCRCIVSGSGADALYCGEPKAPDTRWPYCPSHLTGGNGSGGVFRTLREGGKGPSEATRQTPFVKYLDGRAAA